MEIGRDRIKNVTSIGEYNLSFKSKKKINYRLRQMILTISPEERRQKNKHCEEFQTTKKHKK